MNKIFQEIEDLLHSGYTFKKFATEKVVAIIPTDIPKVKSVTSPSNNIAIFEKYGYAEKFVNIHEEAHSEIEIFIANFIAKKKD